MATPHSIGWVLKYVPLLEQDFCTCKGPVGPGWRSDETYVRVKAAWEYLYQAIDRTVCHSLAAIVGARWLVYESWDRLLDGFWSARLPMSQQGTCWRNVVKTLWACRLIERGSE